MKKRALTPRDIADKKYDVLEWGMTWSGPFGHPTLNETWFVSGPSASGKSTFVMQLAKELCSHGRVLYVSYEEGVSMSFQERMRRTGMHEVQGRFRVVTEDTLEELKARLRKPKSGNWVVIDSFQYAGWTYEQAFDLVKSFPKKGFIFISQEYKGTPMGKAAVRLRYMAGMKVRVIGYRAFCLGRFSDDAGSSYCVWPEGMMRVSNMAERRYAEAAAAESARSEH